MNPNIPKRRPKRATLADGIAQYTTKKQRALLFPETFALIERHVTHQELFQDIKNRIEDIVSKGNINKHLFLGRDTVSFFSVQFKLIATHLVLELHIQGHRRYSRFSKQMHSYHIQTLYLRVSSDGLIVDELQYKELPKYNPGNAVNVLSMDELNYH